MERKVVTRAPHREVGIVNPSWLLDHAVQHESHLEKRFIMVALACPVIVDIVHQPLHIYLGPDETGKYTPDFLIRFRDGDELIVEVKPEVYLEENKDKLLAAQREFLNQKKKYSVLTDEHIDANGLAARALLLMRYARMYFTDDMALECMQLLREQCSGDAKVRDLVEMGVSEFLIWNMVAKHQFRIPAGLNINPAETVSINDMEGDCCDYFHTWFGASQG